MTTTGHGRFLALAAVSLSEPIDAREAAELDEHLRSCGPCRADLTAMANDHRRLQRFVAPRLVPAAMRATVLDTARSGRGVSPWRLLLVAALLALGLYAAAALGGGVRPNSTLGFVGDWTTTNCAAWWEEQPDDHRVSCGRWGDATTFTMRIGSGDAMPVTVDGAGTGSCIGTGRPDRSIDAAPVPGGASLLIELPQADCGSLALEVGSTMNVHHDFGSDTLWFDSDGDGWGLVWYRTGSRP